MSHSFALHREGGRGHWDKARWRDHRGQDQVEGPWGQDQVEVPWGRDQVEGPLEQGQVEGPSGQGGGQDSHFVTMYFCAFLHVKHTYVRVCVCTH